MIGMPNYYFKRITSRTALPTDNDDGSSLLFNRNGQANDTALSFLFMDEEENKKRKELIESQVLRTGFSRFNWYTPERVEFMLRVFTALDSEEGKGFKCVFQSENGRAYRSKHLYLIPVGFGLIAGSFALADALEPYVGSLLSQAVSAASLLTAGVAIALTLRKKHTRFCNNAVESLKGFIEQYFTEHPERQPRAEKA
jgi:hypothetical protein